MSLDTSRLYAFSIHIILSALIFCSVSYMLVVLWYPDIFFTIDGGLKGLKLIALVDIVVGPLLTLILYRKGKKGLKLDMAFICVLQLIFLLYGIWVLYSHRPAALVFYRDTFYSMGVEKFEHQQNGLEKIRYTAGGIPGYVAVHLPDDWDKVRELRRMATAKGEALFAQAEYYAPLAAQRQRIIASGRDLAEYLLHNPDANKEMNQWLGNHGGRMDDFVYIPVVSRFKNTILALDSESGDIRGVVDLDLPPQLELPFINSTF